MKHFVKLFLLLVFVSVNASIVHAQQKHFMYVQSEGHQPFAIILNGKVYSSSDYGYIIIPKLADGDYNFTVSFPMNKFPEQSFTCSINKKDVGFVLKSDNNAWVLENMQTKKTSANSVASAAPGNAFGSMLAGAVNDSSLTQKEVAEQSPAQQNTTEQTTVNNVPGVAAAAATGAAVVAAATDSKPGISQPRKIAETAVDTGTSMLFVDKTETGADTIKVFVPAEQNAASVNTTAESNISPQADIQQPGDNAAVIAAPVVVDASQTGLPNDTVATDVAAQAVPDTAAHEISNPFYKPEPPAGNAVAETVAAGTTAAAAAGSNAVKEDCGNTISEDELNKLKRKMFVQHGDNEMIQYAIKYMNKKCITTSQVKILGGLFASDDGRYNLYDAMYRFVYDYGNYPQLASQIVDPYYKKRFAAMLR